MKDSLNKRHVDQSALKVNQTFIIAFLLLAFIVDNVIIVTAVAIIMLAGTAVPALSLFKQVYARILRPAGLIRPAVHVDNPEPHRFAQGLGGTFVALATLALSSGYALAGWALVWVVIVLAALNLFLGFCAGCFLYYQLNRLGFPGFARKPITN